MKGWTELCNYLNQSLTTPPPPLVYDFIVWMHLYPERSFLFQNCKLLSLFMIIANENARLLFVANTVCNQS